VCLDDERRRELVRATEEYARDAAFNLLFICCTTKLVGHRHYNDEPHQAYRQHHKPIEIRLAACTCGYLLMLIHFLIPLIFPVNHAKTVPFKTKR
jgi:hypothetical protein